MTAQPNDFSVTAELSAEPDGTWPALRRVGEGVDRVVVPSSGLEKAGVVPNRFAGDR